MAKKLARIEVVATVLYSQDRLLLVYNEPWGAFTIPMTKLRAGQPGAGEPSSGWELGSQAAMRNVAECLGFTSVQSPRLLMDLGDLRQSDRSGEVIHYAFQVFGYPVEQQQVHPVILAAWLTPDEVLDPLRQPISPTTRALVTGLKEAALARKGRFPPVAGRNRQSTASVAVISRNKGSNQVWLCQWNQRWGRYFLVGGHQHQGENAQQCMVRELQEELGLKEGNDYTCQLREVLNYEDWSTGAWQTTDYTISTFDVALERPAERKLRGNPKQPKDAANRWVTADEIRCERCDDDKLISSTARSILSRLSAL